MYRLLIADDEKKIRNGLAEYYPWETLGFKIVCKVESGERALQYIESNPVDVVLTDISMPRMSGLELAEVLKEKFPEITVVLLSGYREFVYAKKAIECGVKAYLLKPIKTEELLNLFEQIKEKLDLQYGDKKENGYYELIIESVQHYIRHHLKSANLVEAAESVGMSAGYLSMIFKQKTGSTFSEFLLGCRMEEAKELLRQNEYKAYQVAEMLGYENPKSFSRAFRTHYGISPIEFRRMGSFEKK